MDENKIIEVDVFSGLLRPALAIGVPLGVLISECMFLIVFYVHTHKKLVLAGAVLLLHLFLMFLTSKDIGIFDDIVLMVKVSDKRRSSLKRKIERFGKNKVLTPITKYYGSEIN